jgi:hypothetical protein
MDIPGYRSQSCQTFFFAYKGFFPFFYFKLGHFINIECFQLCNKYSSLTKKSENVEKQSLVGSTPGCKMIILVLFLIHLTFWAAQSSPKPKIKPA